MIVSSFIALIIFLLFLDLKVFHKNPHEVKIKEAFLLTLFWIVLSVLFGVFVYFAYEHNIAGIADGTYIETGSEAFIKYITGYLIEKTLSLDNIFVIALIFAYFKIPLQYQHRVLFWGILGALIFRGIMIFIGVFLIHKFEWITYFFGALLLFSSIKMLRSEEGQQEFDKTKVFKLLQKMFNLTTDIKSSRFSIKKDGKRFYTPLFIALIIIESTDVVFAIDSIPAIFAVTTDSFLVYTSNIFAILGLRSMYFLLAGILDKFKYLKYSLVAILAYVGAKMLLMHFVKIPPVISLIIIAITLTAGIVVSIILSKSKEK